MGHIAEFQFDKLHEQPPADMETQATWLRSTVVFGTHEEASRYGHKVAIMLVDVRAIKIIPINSPVTHVMVDDRVKIFRG